MGPNMELIQPWNTSIGKISFSDLIDVQDLLNEVMQHPQVMENTKVGALRINQMLFPKASRMIDKHLRPIIEGYIYDVGGRRPDNLKWSSWYHICIHGVGLVPHYHNDALTSVFYLTDSKANLVLRDTRANIARHWPQDMLDGVHGNYEVNPRKGDFVVFPGYIDHYVISEEPDFRISIAVDWNFE